MEKAKGRRRTCENVKGNVEISLWKEEYYRTADEYEARVSNIGDSSKFNHNLIKANDKTEKE